MSPSMMGAMLGFSVGLVGFIALRIAASRMEARKEVENRMQVARVIRMVAIADWLLMIAAGFIIGPFILSAPN